MEPFHPTVIIIGAGYSGICAAVQLQTRLGLHSYNIFDNNKDIGGVWIKNRYPGCAVDSPSHTYTYSFAMEPYTSKNILCNTEICDYLKRVAVQNSVYEKIKFNVEVKSLHWNEEIKKWLVTIQNLQNGNITQFHSDIVINATGAFRVPHRPKDFDTFSGPKIHSAEWDETVDLRDKIVGVVGSGASGVQLVNALHNVVKELHYYQRQPTWVFPFRPDFKYPHLVQQAFAKVPFLLWFLRWFIYWFFEFLLYPMIFQGSRTSRFMKNFGSRYLENKFKSKERLREQVKPNHDPGCKTLLVSNEYFDSLKKPNVFLHSGIITRITNDSFVTEEDGQNKLDVLILATGFKLTEYFGPMLIFGRDNEDILKSWKETAPKSYLGVISNKTPNLFTILGANTYLAHNTVGIILECQVNFIVNTLEEMIAKRWKCVSIKSKVEDEYMELLNLKNSQRVYSGSDCKTYYKNDKGIVTFLYPMSMYTYWRATSQKDFSKFNFC